MFNIVPFEQQYTAAICTLIVHIQQNEFQVPITLSDQPDLLQISKIYQQNGGNFWVAVAEGGVVGTLALIDCGNGIGCIRKMFVHADWRGKERGLASYFSTYGGGYPFFREEALIIFIWAYYGDFWAFSGVELTGRLFQQ